MRIAYVLTSIGMGGAERQALTLAARMAERRHSAHVIVLRRVAEEWPAAVPVLHLGLRKRLFSSAAGLLRAMKLLRELRPDIVHSHSIHANLFARALRVLVPGPVLISTVHNVYEGGWLRMMAYRWTDRLSTRTATVSEAVAHRFIALKAISARRCVVIPNAIEIEECVPDAERRAAARAALGAGDDFVWLAAGRIVPAKDYLNLLRAFAPVRAAMPRTRLWIAGQGVAGAEEPLRRLAAELEISDCVFWLGLRRDLPALLDAADGFVSSSAWEGMPLTLAEAMAMEKPVVATDTGGVRELMGEVGRVVSVQDGKALARAMMGVMLEPAERRRAIGQAARARIRTHFSMDARADEWEEIYRAVVNECA